MARNVFRRRSLVLTLVATVLAAGSSVGWALWRAHEADVLVAEARARLGASLLEAPELDRIQASGAVSRLERACELGLADDARVVGLRQYANALEDFQQRDLILAEGELTAARHRLGWTPDVRVLAAAIAHARTDVGAARAHLQEALSLDPLHARAHLLSADIALDARRHDEALDHLERLARIEPRSAAVLNRRGLGHEGAGDLDAAERDYRAAAALDPRDADPRINLGRLLRALERDRDALAAFDGAVRVAPTDADAWLGRGLSRAALGDAEGATVALARAAELAPHDAEPLLALGDLQRDAGQVAEAIVTYRAAIVREDADAASWLKLGHALMMAGDPDRAAAAYRESIQRAPRLAAAHNGLGAALSRIGQDADARDALERAAELDTADPNPWLNLALLHERTGNRPAARAAWQSALTRDPENPLALRRAGS
jgi:tetratricopeptide (TPR) repeat protein